MNWLRALRRLLPVALAVLPSAALAQSTINPNVPTQNSPLSSAVMRNNFAAAYADVNTLYGLINGATFPLTNGSIYVGNASNVATARTMSGDCGITNLGAVICLRTNGVLFAASATIDATNASNISAGTLNSLRLSTIYALDIYARSGRPVADVRAYGAVSDNVTDDFPAFDAARVAVEAFQGSGVIYVPPASGSVYCIKTGPVHLQAAGTVLRGANWDTKLSSCSSNNSLVRMSTSDQVVTDLYLAGPGGGDGETAFGASVATLIADNNCVQCRIENLQVFGGLHAIEWHSGEMRATNIVAANAYGSSIIYFQADAGQVAAGWLTTIKPDENEFPNGLPAAGTTFAARLPSHAYSAGPPGDVAGWQCQDGRFYYFQVVAGGGGTSGAGAAPTCKNRGQNITDGTVTWTMTRPNPYYHYQLDSGTSEVFLTNSDTGGGDAGVALTHSGAGGGAAPGLFRGVNLNGGSGYVANFWGQAGSDFHITGFNTGGCISPGCGNFLFNTAFTGTVKIGTGNCNSAPFCAIFATGTKYTVENVIGQSITSGPVSITGAVDNVHFGGIFPGAPASTVTTSGTNVIVQLTDQPTSPPNGGTGVRNAAASTITLANPLVTAGAFPLTLTVTATTNATLPAGSHVLAGLDVTQSWSAAQTFTSITLMNLNANLAASPLAGRILRIAAADNAIARIELDTFGNSASFPGVFSCIYGRGTGAAPTAVQANDELCSLNAWGYTGANVQTATAVAAVRFFANQTFSAGNQGSYIRLSTTANAGTTLTDRVGVENDGGMTVPPGVTGGSCGSGCINATALRVANVAVLTANQTITLSGDLTGSGTTAITSTFATVNANVGTFGSATQASQVTVNAKGLTTAAANVTITPAVGSITGLGTGVITALGVNIGTAGAFVTNGGALGSPSSAGTIPGFTLGGAIAGGGNQINNVVIGTTSPGSGAFTTVSGSTSVTSPLYVGGSGTTGIQATFKTTTGVGTTDSYAFTCGNNGATTCAALSATGFGVGTTAANTDVLLKLNANTATPLAASVAGAHLVLADGVPGGWQVAAFASNGINIFRRANTTAAAPSGLADGDSLGRFVWQGYATTTNDYVQTAILVVTAVGGFNNTQTGSKMTLSLTPPSTTGVSQRHAFWGSGGLSVGSTAVATDPGNGGVLIDGTFKTAATTDATSTSTGALQIPGGASINKRVWMNGLSASSAGLSAACVENTGEITTNTGVTTCLVSAREWKTNIRPLPDISAGLLALKTRLFDWRDASHGPNDQIGFIADEVASVDSRLAIKGTVDGVAGRWASWKHEAVTVMLVQGYQHHDQVISTLRADNDNLRAEIELLRARQ